MEAMHGGDLYQLQQEAISRARETAKKAAQHESLKPEKVPVKLPQLSSDNMVIIAVLALLLLNGCHDMMLILALALGLFL